MYDTENILNNEMSILAEATEHGISKRVSRRLRELLKLEKETIYSKTNIFNYFEQNKGFDINNDGIITNAEMTKYFFIVP